MAEGGEFNTLDNVRHGTGAVRSKNLDGIDVGLLGNTILLSGNSSGAMSAVAITILILITRGNGLAPLGTSLKINVVDVGASVNDISVNTLTSARGVQVLVEGTKVESISVGDTSETPRSLLLGIAVTLVFGHTRLGFDGNHGVDDGVALNELNLIMVISMCLLHMIKRDGTYIWVVPDLLDHGLVEVTGIPLERLANLEAVLHAREDVGIGLAATLAELEAHILISLVKFLDPCVVIRGRRVVDVVLELDDVGVGDNVCLDGAQNRSRVFVDGANFESAGLGHGDQRKSHKGPHDDVMRDNGQTINQKLLPGSSCDTNSTAMLDKG